MRSLLVSMENFKCILMKYELVIRAYHSLETQRKRTTDFTGNRISISAIRSCSKFDIMEMD